ncbi:DUF742 domain-containing protein [Phytomonospora sp. NPDC050363]|uniref:DUF742 domain-containing protein n=1 Tax=Phytomonospora sp. NPDC050363 TaxID=3155642 RepID=UPI003402F0C8
MRPIRRTRVGLVRSHTTTGGATATSRSSLDASTLLYPDLKAPLAELDPTSARVMNLLRTIGAMSISEAAAHLKIPFPFVVICADRLIDSGHVFAKAPTSAEQATAPGVDVLERLLHGLQQL